MLAQTRGRGRNTEKTAEQVLDHLKARFLIAPVIEPQRLSKLKEELETRRYQIDQWNQFRNELSGCGCSYRDG